MGFIKANFEIEDAYTKINNEKKKFGKYHKTIFHIHTPSSYDYKLISKQDCNNFYLSSTDDEMLEIAIKNLPMLEFFEFDVEKNNDISIYNSKKEFLGFLLMANELAEKEIEIAVVTDHNTIDGYEKLKRAIKVLNNSINKKVYTEVILGIEISCSDKNHVVGIFDDKKINISEKIKEWLEDCLMNEQDGTYLTSLDVISKIKEIGGISYIAHFDNSDFFKDDKFLNKAYKSKLFSLEFLNIIGLANRSSLERIQERLRFYSTHDYCYVLDDDSHSLDEIGNNFFWLKGNKINYNMVVNALRDYNICVDFDAPLLPQKYIKGIVIKNDGKGFLKGKDENDFCVSFSEYLNCFIGGRGTGKSTIINIIEYIIQQKIEDEKKLDLFCKYRSIWLLFVINEKEYMIQLHNPQKELDDDNILKYFCDYNTNYYQKLNFDYLKIKKYLLKKYIFVYELKYENDKLKTKSVSNKSKYLDDVFNTAYSVNELVETSSGESINQYIYDTLFKNKTIASVNSTLNVKNVRGLKRALKEFSSVKELRKKQVFEIIDKFNDKEKNILKIIYNQNESDVQFVDFKELLSYNNSIGNLEKFYNGKNIKMISVIDYLEELKNNLGIERFLSLFIDKNINELKKIVPIGKYLEKETTRTFESGITIIDSSSIEILINDIINDIINDKTISKIINSLKRYIKDIESFDLEFNVNNKEQTNTAINFKSVKYLSLGQKVVAMLSFVLSYSDFSNDYSPLVIDQPEDNLDNQYIYKNLVKTLKEIKSKRQIIIATHNATIVTNAKAEQVVVMESDNEHGWISATGYPNENNIKRYIINCLEGGVDSFNHKYFIYKEILNKK